MNFKQFYLIILSLLISFQGFSQKDIADKMMIVVIDGARYSETFGDPDHTHVPMMWDIAQDGVIIDEFYNDNYTYTSRAIPALWTGSWTDVRDTVYNGSSTSYAVNPSIFEYYRKQKGAEAEDCFYVLKYISSLWLPSFNFEYGTEYWPAFHSVGVFDEDVGMETQYVMDTYHPHFLWVYLADVDHEGHSGNWSNYINAIERADNIVGMLWDKLQSDPFYAGTTNLIVTNDHGRHDDQHGGFTGHGCGCEGCRHIQFLAAGPGIKNNFVSTQYRTIPDMAATAAYMLGLDADYSTGNIMYEILQENNIEEQKIPTLTLNEAFPNPFSEQINISYTLTESRNVEVLIYNQMGKLIKSLIAEEQTPGRKNLIWEGTNQMGSIVDPGLYYFKIICDSDQLVGKMIFSRD